jgi:formamidopyrimidine-DNA glycosylase
MPELPDIELYLHALRPRIVGQPLERARIASPFLVRSVDPPLYSIDGKVVRGLRRLGKRIVWGMDDDIFVVIHLMIAGRFKWAANDAEKRTRAANDADDTDHKPKARRASRLAKNQLGEFVFPTGTLVLTEAGTKKRASLYLVRGERALADHDPGGIDVLDSSLTDFANALTPENHTLKRSLTDPHLFSGIGNAYSDEILLQAKLSPMALTGKLSKEEIATLHRVTIATLIKWRDALIAETGDRFPEKVTAFRPEMGAHGKFGKPCPQCGTPIQRIRYADNECNYCPACQTGGRLLADRGLSRLLKSDWPRSLEELDTYKARRRV